MKPELDINHEFTKNIVCPWCGHEHDPTDFLPEGEENCDECKQRFYFEAQYEVSYCTGKIEKVE